MISSVKILFPLFRKERQTMYGEDKSKSTPNSANRWRLNEKQLLKKCGKNKKTGQNGQKVRILSLGSIPPEAAARLRALGLFRGSSAILLRQNRFGAVILRFRGTRMAFGRAIAAEIEVACL